MNDLQRWEWLALVGWALGSSGRQEYCLNWHLNGRYLRSHNCDYWYGLDDCCRLCSCDSWMRWELYWWWVNSSTSLDSTEFALNSDASTCDSNCDFVVEVLVAVAEVAVVASYFAVVHWLSSLFAKQKHCVPVIKWLELEKRIWRHSCHFLCSEFMECLLFYLFDRLTMAAPQKTIPTPINIDVTIAGVEWNWVNV